MSDIRVSSWAELTEALYADAWHAEIGRFRSDFAFRGVELPAPELLTGLTRLGGNFAEMEGHLLRNFRKYERDRARALPRPRRPEPLAGAAVQADRPAKHGG